MNEYFLNEIKQLFPDEYQQFVDSFSIDMYKSLRINDLKCSREELLAEGFTMGERTPFDPDSYYVITEDKLGNHPFHNAGCYYLQEPSAAAPVNALGIEPGDRVADLCAAPGGKSTQILNRLNGTGMLWSNEIVWKRCQTLLSNLERWGYANYLLTSMNTAEMADLASGWFDRVLIDAPCSGASMFKKYPDSINEYNESAVKACRKRQLEILENGYQLLKQEGTLVYSTCTYNLIENEETVWNFLKRHPDMELTDTGLKCGRKGMPYKDLKSEYLTRITPLDKGEGHFVARMVKHSPVKEKRLNPIAFTHNRLVDEFLKEYGISCSYYMKNNEVYYCNEPLDIRNTVRQGVLLGTIEKNRFEPHHHLFMCPQISNSFSQNYEINDRDQLVKYLKGESLNAAGIRGYVAVRYQGKTLGFAKGDGRQLKNRLPKGLRNLSVL